MCIFVGHIARFYKKNIKVISGYTRLTCQSVTRPSGQVGYRLAGQAKVIHDTKPCPLYFDLIGRGPENLTIISSLSAS